MFTHCVFFWAKPGLAPQDLAAFEKGVRSLITIESVVHGFAGRPSDTDRPVIDRSYTFGLVVVFADAKGHDAYQTDPIHDAFRDSCSKYWQRVQVYDFE
jgi:hypothetical protein